MIKKEEMKILHILDKSLPNISGYSLRSGNILRFQKKLGLDVAAVTSPNQRSSALQEEIEGITYYRTRIPKLLSANFIKNNPFLKSSLCMLLVQKKIEEIIKNNNVDIIHAHSPLLCGVAALKAAEKNKVPVIYEVRALWEDAAVDLGKTKTNSLRYRLTRHLETRLFKKAAAVIAICQGLKDEVISRGISKDKVYVVPNGVESNSFVPKPKDEELLKKYSLNGETVFGFIGSFFEFEGLEYFIKAIAKISGADKDIKAIVVGGGRREEELRSLAERACRGKNIIFTGLVSHSEAQRLYSIVDILVYPRVKNRLTDLVTPLKPLEAMAMEKAVIASDVGGLKELIEDGSTGLLFEAGNMADLTDKMLHLAHKSEIRLRLGKAARQEIIKNRDWKDLVKRYDNLYSQVINS